MSSRHQHSSTFLDVCAAGTPLAAIARCLLDARASSRDVLHLAQAVGKQYRPLVLCEVEHLPDLKLQFEGVPARDTRAGARLLLQLENVQTVWAACDEEGEHLLCDAEGLTLLRLLPRLKRLKIDKRPHNEDFEGTCRALTALKTLEELQIGWWCTGDSDLGREGVQEAAGHLAQLQGLTRLDACSMMLATDGIRHLAGLTALRELDLSYENDLCDANLAPLSALTNLTQLTARCAYVNGDAMLHIGPWATLRTLDLGAAVGLEPAHILHLTGLTALTELSLGYNTLTGDSIGAIAQLHRLAALDISSTQIGESDLAPLRALRGLHTLDCSCNRLGPSAALHLGQCRALRHLCVDQNRLGPEGVHHLMVLTGLRHLDIAHNGIGATGASHIAGSLTALTSLLISDNVLGAAGAAHIARMTQLRALHVMNNCLDDAAVQLLIRSLTLLSDSDRYRSLKHQQLSQRRLSIDT